MTRLEFRHLSEDQIGSFVDVVALSRAAHPFERRLTPDEAKTFTLLDPDFDPKGSWMAYLDGKAIGVGYALVEKSRIETGMDDGYVEIEVVPEHRDEGVEQQLLDLSIGYLRSRDVGKLRTRTPISDKWKKSFLESQSLREEYRVYVLVRKGSSAVQIPSLPEGYRLERKSFGECSDADIATIVKAFNDAFRDHFAFAPEPPERWTAFRDGWKDPIMFTLVVKDGVIAGVCMTEESVVFNKERGVKSGWIDVLGVRPAHRRHGLAKAMLADGVRWLLDRGMDMIYIGVYAKNEKALGLYESFGFEKDQESIWYTGAVRRRTA